MNLSVICVNWHSADYLDRCLESVFSLVSGIDMEVIVVDNASFDGAGDLVKKKYPTVRFLQLDRNVGFAKASNMAFGQSTGRNILLLNPDTELLPDAIPTMLEALERREDAAAVGCKLLNSDLSVQTSCIQKFPTVLNQLLDIERLRRLWPDCNLWRIAPLFDCESPTAAVDAVSGACMMIKRGVFEQLGMLSEEFFIYAEDMDFCYRIRRNGMKVYYVGAATVIHHGAGSASWGGHSSWTSVMQKRAMAMFFRKHYGNLPCITYRIAMGVMAVLRLMAIGLPATLKKFQLNDALAKAAGTLIWSIGLDKVALFGFSGELRKSM